ncbi:MAG TPA: protein-disulfide reductase DsbD domain-containing protein [Phycisphaerae bacterium]|nr:protein-disulfide reductase DsbD domain-containing protein [Phycisphaerae bacterium]
MAKVKARLFADRSALVPGQAIQLGIGFEIAEGWHIYWQNSGEGGMAPSFKWIMPEGFEVGPIRFPLPKRHVDAIGAHTYVLEGEPVLLTVLKVPADLKPGGEVVIGANARWLACREVCVIETQELELKLPVAAGASEAKLTHADDFKYAGGRLPLEAAKAKHLETLTAAADVDRLAPGAKFRVAVVLEVEPGFHVNSNKPLIKGLIPTDVFPYKVEGLNFEQPVFPAGRIEKSELGELSLYSGRTVIVLPIEADNELEGERVRIGGVLTYQACEDKTKQCYPPTGAEWEVTLPIARVGEAVRSVNEDVFTESGPGAGTQRSAEGSGTREAGSWLQRVQARLAGLGIVGYLVMALIGGFILNLMPCVLPVISIKILSFVQQAGESRLRIFTLGAVFALGIEVSFLVLGGIIIGLGQYLGVSQQWGGLFQSPQVVIGLSAVVLAFALSLFGVFSLNPPTVVNELGGKVQREGHLSAFGMGLLATFLGTACTAPFLSAVVAIAVKQPPANGLLIFATAGVGMAFPYLLLAAQPAWIKIIPRPGAWMATFEHLVGFCLLATVVWLLNPLTAQIGGDGLQWALVFLLLVAVAAWVYGRLGFDAPPARKLRSWSIIAILVVGGWVLCFRVVHTIPELAAAQRAVRAGGIGIVRGWDGPDIPWVVYTRQGVTETVKAGKTVFVDYTADWCATCKTNERLILSSREVREAMRRLGVVPFKADYTSFDPEIKKDLEDFGRSGVPMYVIYPAGRPDEPILLDELLFSASAVVEALEKAGPSKPIASAPAQ